MKISFRAGKSRLKYALCIAFLSVLAAGFVCVLVQMKPVFEQKAAHAAKVAATGVINKAAAEVFDGITSAETVNIITDGNGTVTAVNTDTAAINRLKTKLSEKLLLYAKSAERATVYIPAGSLTPYEALQGIGFRIPLAVSIDGFSNIDFKSDFESAGINQVRHKIYMVAAVEVSVISSVMTKTETVTAEIPVAETVIAGTVPNYYGNNFGVIGDKNGENQG